MPVIDIHELAASLVDGTTQGKSVQVGAQTIKTQGVLDTEHTQAVLYWLRAGQAIPRHRHTGIDDIFLGLRGRGRVRHWGDDGGADEIRISPGRIHAVVPGTVHEVVSDSDDFVYLLLQAPREDYDLVAEDPA